MTWILLFNVLTGKCKPRYMSKVWCLLLCIYMLCPHYAGIPLNIILLFFCLHVLYLEEVNIWIWDLIKMHYPSEYERTSSNVLKAQRQEKSEKEKKKAKELHWYMNVCKDVHMCYFCLCVCKYIPQHIVSELRFASSVTDCLKLKLHPWISWIRLESHHKVSWV